jgi:hypothetical protein
MSPKKFETVAAFRLTQDQLNKIGINLYREWWDEGKPGSKWRVGWDEQPYRDEDAISLLEGLAHKRKTRVRRHKDSSGEVSFVVQTRGLWQWDCLANHSGNIEKNEFEVGVERWLIEALGENEPLEFGSFDVNVYSKYWYR